LLSNEKATGVEYEYNSIFHSAEKSNAKHVVKARKLVLVSAGTFGSPAILERSGIGKKDVLNKAGVDVLVELNGVGENFQGISSSSLELEDCDSLCRPPANWPKIFGIG
jgi:alcohol oxidase